MSRPSSFSPSSSVSSRISNQCHDPTNDDPWQTTYQREYTWKSPGRPPSWVSVQERYGVRNEGSQTNLESSKVEIEETERNWRGKVEVAVQTELTGESGGMWGR